MYTCTHIYIYIHIHTYIYINIPPVYPPPPPFLVQVTKGLLRLRGEQLKLTDQRVKITNELIQIRIKYVPELILVFVYESNELADIYIIVY